MEFQSSEMWTIPGWVHVGVTCQSNIHIPHIVTRSLHLLWFSRHCRSVAHDERAALAHQCSECCTSLHVCQRGSEKGINTCSGPNVLEQRRQKQDVISEISHTLLCSTVLLLVLLAARWWTFGVSTRVLGFFWDSCDLSFSYNSCFLFGFFMVWIWNVVFLPSIPGLFCPIYLGFSFTSLDCMCVYDLFLPLSCGFPVRSLSVQGLVCRFFLWILTFWTLPK